MQTLFITYLISRNYKISIKFRCCEIEELFVVHRLQNTSIIIALSRGSFTQTLTRSDTCQFRALNEAQRALRLSLHATGSRDTRYLRGKTKLTDFEAARSSQCTACISLNQSSFPDHPSRRDRSYVRKTMFTYSELIREVASYDQTRPRYWITIVKHMDRSKKRVKKREIEPRAGLTVQSRLTNVAPFIHRKIIHQ